MIITLTPDLERALIEQAHKLGTTPEQLALDSLRAHFAQAASRESPSKGRGTLADFFQGHIGILHSSDYIPGGARMSENSGKKFAAGLLKQREQEER